MYLCFAFAGAPLSESDFKPLENMGTEIRNWILQRSQKATAIVNVNVNADADYQHPHNTTAATAAATAIDLYDF